MVATLRAEIHGLERVAAIGPNYRHGDGYKFVGSTPAKVEQVISSGCLISVAALRDVGLMNEALFIDLVDTEWMLRAKQKGWIVYQSARAMMEHKLGEGSIRIWFGRWHHVPKHSALRHYYYVRNSIYLYAYSKLPRRWKLSSAKRLAIRFIAFPSHIGMMLSGAYDGLRGRMGAHRLFCTKR
jgi:rhamnosyltransferase